MRAMNERQYNIVKIFIDGLKIPPKTLVKKWAKYGVNVELHEVCRVLLTVNFSVYSRDDIADEDVLLAVFGR